MLSGWESFAASLTRHGVSDVVERLNCGTLLVGAPMIVETLVLVAALLSIIAIIVSFIPQRRVLALDERQIDTATQLDAAMAIQRSKRIREFQRRVNHRNAWPYALLSLAFLIQMAALAVDHLAHPSNAIINVLPAFCIVFAIRASRRRNAKRQLDRYVRSEPSSPPA